MRRGSPLPLLIFAAPATTAPAWAQLERMGLEFIALTALPEAPAETVQVPLFELT